MQTEVIFAGYGGQGVMYAGQLVAYAALESNHQVTWMPSYGPEMRGGTANCTVIVSDEEIGSPFVRTPSAAVVMNVPSLDKYENRVISGGVLIVNSSMIDRVVQRNDIKIVYVPSNEVAEKIGDQRMSNMVLLGALLGNLPFLELAQIETTLKNHTAERHEKLIPLNIQALRRGAKFIG